MVDSTTPAHPRNIDTPHTEPNGYIAAAATGVGVIATYVNSRGDVSIMEMHIEQGDVISVPVAAIPDLIEMLRRTLRAFGMEAR